MLGTLSNSFSGVTINGSYTTEVIQDTNRGGLLDFVIQVANGNGQALGRITYGIFAPPTLATSHPAVSDTPNAETPGGPIKAVRGVLSVAARLRVCRGAGEQQQGDGEELPHDVGTERHTFLVPPVVQV